jgi:hypothetical protein
MVLGFWPLGPEDFFEKFKIEIARKFVEYHYILFFELPSEKDFLMQLFLTLEMACFRRH